MLQPGPATIVTVKLHLAVLAQSSVAVQVTVVVPTAKALPEGGAQTTTGVESHASVAVATKVTA
jgi:hypothetical protein